MPLVVPPELELLKRLEGQRHDLHQLLPVLYTIGPSSSVAQKREQMLRFGESVIAKL